ncbi:hypothetical protein P9747_19420, partial [Paenibacillus macerans]|nr:hypothetical protein [Paenibacillus macerans]
WYTDRFKQMACALLTKHGRAGSETRGAQASSGIGTEVPDWRPGAVPQPTCTVSEREITPEVEQLSFPF